MKKLVFMFVAFAAISFASCGNKAEQATPANDSDSLVVASDSDSLAGDSLTGDSTTAAEAAPGE